MTQAKPWFWRIRGTKYMPAGWTGSLVLIACLAAMIAGLTFAALNAIAAQWLTVPMWTSLAGAGLLALIWACANRAQKHPKSRWRD